MDEKGKKLLQKDAICILQRNEATMFEFCVLYEI